MAMATMHPNCSTLSTSDPVSTLINRAMAFRHTLSQASGRLNLKDTADRVIYKEEEDEEENDEEEEVKEEDDDDDDDEDERELSIEDPRYVAEKALLQELFFPEAEKAPSDDAGKMILSLPPPSLSFLLNFTNPNISAFLDIKCFSFVFAAL